MSFHHVGITDIHIRRFPPLTILRLPKLISEFSFVTAFVILASTIDGRVLTAMSITHVIKVMCSYCDTIAIGDISSYYELIGSQLSTNGFMSPRASESALSYTHRVRNCLMIGAKDRTHNLAMLYWSQRLYRPLRFGRQQSARGVPPAVFPPLSASASQCPSSKSCQHHQFQFCNLQ
jgi:hypothetical protein